MASGSDESGGRHPRPPPGARHLARQRRIAELEKKRDELQEDIDWLRNEIYFFAEGISETSYDETVDTAIAKRQAAIAKREAKRDALQEKIDAL